MKNNDKIDEISSKIDKMIELQMLILDLITNNKKKIKKININECLDTENKCNEVKQSIEEESTINEMNKIKYLTKQLSQDEPIMDEKIKKKNQLIKNPEYKDVKKEIFNIDIKIIKDCLNMNNQAGDIKLFKKMYIENIPKEYYPIRHIQKNLQYWLNNHMNDDDSNGTYIKNVIISNIENCYLSVNIFDNYSDNMEQFLKNQEHINKLSENKYKDNLLNKIISLISI